MIIIHYHDDHHTLSWWSSYIIMMMIIHYHDDNHHHHYHNQNQHNHQYHINSHNLSLIYAYIIINMIISITSTDIINHSFTLISANPRRYLQLARYSSALNHDESYDFPDDENNRYIKNINYHQSLSLPSSSSVSHH